MLFNVALTVPFPAQITIGLFLCLPKMKHIKHMWRYCIAIVLLACGCCHVWAQNVVFTATAGANKIGIKDQVQAEGGMAQQMHLGIAVHARRRALGGSQ